MQAVLDWLVTALPWIAHGMLILCVVGGIVGSLIPAVPGAVAVWGGALLHGLLTGWQPLGLWTQLSLTALLALSIGSSYAISAAGAKKYGASKWGIGGAAVGMLLGLFIPIPILGPFLGAFVGALAAEYLTADREAEGAGKDAARAGFGAMLGAVVGLMAEFGIALVMGAVVFLRFVAMWLG